MESITGTALYRSPQVMPCADGMGLDEFEFQRLSRSVSPVPPPIPSPTIPPFSHLWYRCCSLFRFTAHTVQRALSPLASPTSRLYPTAPPPPYLSMARKARQRISYILPLANSPGGHRLGVNSLAVDKQGILYSAGRDGAVCSWKIGVDLADGAANSAAIPRPAPPPSTFFTQAQAHTHWVNDLALCHSNAALVSASSDLTVKLWRPHAADQLPPETIGVHSDYVKCLATPDEHSDWVASGGLDRKIMIWDLNGGGEKLQIDVGDEGTNPKGSIYSLGIGGGIIASGGPESVVRVWDPRSGQRITKFVGHTDNVRSILVSQQGNIILTASSDTTIKMWSLTAGRCIHTLSMHNDSVWSLYSSHPNLDIFHSSDRSGLVAKTDVRNVDEIEEGICVAVCQDQEGVNKVVACGDYLWTATQSSSINRWLDVDTNTDIGPDPRRPRLSTTSAFPSNVRDPDAVTVYSIPNARQASISETILDADPGVLVPVNDLPDETIEGQHGLIKHFLLNDRRRVLTLDTAGEVMMWDLLKCMPVKSFGKRHLEDVAAEVNTVESVANWCQIDTRTGRLACVLEENYCFDAEMYADEADIEDAVEFRDDQRINLGKWVLRYLFSNLINEEIARDEDYRKRLDSDREEREQMRRTNAPPQISMPPVTFSSDIGTQSPGGASVATPKAHNGFSLFPQTPGMVIGLATPALTLAPSNIAHAGEAAPLPTTNEEESGPRASLSPTTRGSIDKLATGDYFSTGSTSNATPTKPISSGPSLGEAVDDAPATPSTADKEKEEKDSSLLGRWRSFGTRKLGRSASTDTANKPTVSTVDEKPSGDESAISDKPDPLEDTLLGVLKKIRGSYEIQVRERVGEPFRSSIAPSLPLETPVLKPPGNTTIIIQEDRLDFGGVADLYRGTVSCVGEDADLLEKVAPAWLGDLILLNRIPLKDTVKVSFVLIPWQDKLPQLPSDEGKNSRLNANRMLRAKKIAAYVAERLEPPFMTTSFSPEIKEGQNPPKPEDWLELLCHDQIVPPAMTLATIRSYVWKAHGDVVLHYRRRDGAGVSPASSTTAVEVEKDSNGEEGAVDNVSTVR
ncbi:unnamed protein product [Tuber melanosporum]|uniref:(Perigord truffle) hypothetical protein n=1 Tax=Tuber melanosporum (strain Mel28) TaxID=656061 RepID=D5GCV6_TUBMM|nr:uncharacterized protein GSTUM_00000793001 [Tuber melanosporum]CAZ82349.1 unnamed protein product [Tuber melanosporum]